MKYRHIGTETAIGEMPKLQAFGEAIDLPEKLAAELIAPPGNPGKGVPLLPEAEFAKLGFTAQELEQYRWPASHATAPAEFLKKKTAALIALDALRNKPAAVGAGKDGQ
jgi:hypothetical protein